MDPQRRRELRGNDQDPAVVVARVVARELQDTKNRLQAEELARRKLARRELEKKVAIRIDGDPRPHLVVGQRLFNERHARLVERVGVWTTMHASRSYHMAEQKELVQLVANADGRPESARSICVRERVGVVLRHKLLKLEDVERVAVHRACNLHSLSECRQEEMDDRLIRELQELLRLRAFKHNFFA